MRSPNPERGKEAMFEALTAKVAGWAFRKNKRRLDTVATVMELLATVRGQAIAETQVAASTSGRLPNGLVYEELRGGLRVQLIYDTSSMGRAKVGIQFGGDDIVTEALQRLLGQKPWFADGITRTRFGLECRVACTPQYVAEAYLDALPIRTRART